MRKLKAQKPLRSSRLDEHLDFECMSLKRDIAPVDIVRQEVPLAEHDQCYTSGLAPVKSLSLSPVPIAADLFSSIKC